MQASIITIGDEILIGQVVDTNSAFMAIELNKIGVKVVQTYSISDTEEAIISTLDNAVELSDLVLITGGLGPTKDDITKHALANYFKCGLVRHQETYKRVEARMKQFGVKISEINKSQADVPENCSVLLNNAGSAPGMLFTSDNTTIVSMPGVPFEMKDIMQTGVIPYLKNNFTLPVLLHKTYLTVGVGESMLAERLEDFENSLPNNFSFAYLPSPGTVRLRLSCNGENYDELSVAFAQQGQLLENHLGDDLFGFDNDTLESIVGSLLRDNGFTISTAESCTGGNIAKVFTSVPGASDYFMGSIVSYSNQAKSELLEVPEDILQTYGAVSKQAVEYMANNVKIKFKSDFGIATSGVAGPGGGTPEKPVGTVWICIASPKRTLSLKFGLGENRERTVIRSTILALNLVRKEIKSIVKKTSNKV